MGLWVILVSLEQEARGAEDRRCRAQGGMAPGGTARTPILLLITTIIITWGCGAHRDAVGTPGLFQEVEVHPDSVPRSALSMGDGKKRTSKLPLDNSSGLKKTEVGHHSSRPAAPRDRTQPDPILTTPHNHTKGVPHHESNRPGKSHPQVTEAARLANRHPAGPLPHLRVSRKDAAERTCVAECHRERDEQKAYCHSDFALNGIIHDMDAVGEGARILTVLVTHGGLYKVKRLYLTPDSGAFSRVTVLALHTPHCHTPGPHLQLGGRYIIMGQIYRQGMQVPPPVLRAVSGRLRAGDGLVTSGRGFIRRYNRKKDGWGLQAALSRCT